MSQHAAQAKTIQVILLLVLMGMVSRGTAFSQSLADLARQQRAKKAAEEQTAPQYTNDAMDAVQPEEDTPPGAPALAAPAAKPPRASNADVEPDPTTAPDTSPQEDKTAATDFFGAPTAEGKTDLAGANKPSAKLAPTSTGSAGTKQVHLAPPSINQLISQIPAWRLLFSLIELLVGVVVCAAMWAVFIKAGEPGWASITPFYNMFVLLKIAAKPVWWMVLFLIPLVNLGVLIKINIELARRFGKDLVFGIGLTFLPFIFFPILAWSDASISN